MSPTCQPLPDTSAALRGLAAIGVVLALALVAAGQEAIAKLLIIAPAAEEIIFRAGLQEALLRRAGTARFATAATGLAFAVAHLALHPGIAAALTLLPALLIGRIYERGRNLGPCVAVHASCNAAWLLWAGASA